MWLAVDSDGSEYMYSGKPVKSKKLDEFVVTDSNIDVTYLDRGTIEFLIGRKLTFDESPVELVEKDKTDGDMTVELNRSDLYCLLRGTFPSFKLTSKLNKMGLGYYTGGFEEGWTWTLRFADNYTEQELWDLYKEITKKE